jgi:hypothetical protein
VLSDLLDGYWDGERPTRSSPSSGRGLFQSHRDAGTLLARAKDVLDGAVPSGSSAAALAIARLGMLTGDLDALAVADRLVELGEPLLDAQPHAAASLTMAACLLADGVEVAVPGPRGDALEAARAAVPPFSVLAHGQGPLSLLDGREAGLVYVCRHATCEAPIREVSSVAAALATAARWEEGA